MEVIQRILAAVLISRKAGDVINNKFGVVDRSEAAAAA